MGNSDEVGEGEVREREREAGGVGGEK
jgi:hypothetical protein